MKNFFFDAHCDTGSACLEQRVGIKRNSLHLDLDRMIEFDGYIQVFAAFVDKKQISCSAFEHCMSILTYLRDEISRNMTQISLVTTEADLKDVFESGKPGAILSVEGGEALDGSLENLTKFYETGVRLITLTWNYANEIAEGVCGDSCGGLTEFGRQAVSAMEKMGILIDVSHLSEKGFWDVVEHTRFPFVASHSNAKKLCVHPRNLSDEQIKCIIKRNGCIGINFYPVFLTDEDRCEIHDILNHMEYILKLGGEDALGFGSDFDGVDCLPEKILGIESMKDVLDAMKQRGFSDKQTEKICFGNFNRVFAETLGRRK